MNHTQEYYAEQLLKVRGFRFSTNPPFVSVSGLKEPIYHDHRLLMTFPDFINDVANDMINLTMKNYGKPELVVGVAVGALPYATMVAQKLHLPMAYVRSMTKQHGRKRLVEGIVKKNAKAIIIEDVLVFGTSAINAQKAIISSGATVLGVISIYNLQLNKLKVNLKEQRLSYCSLYNLDVLMKVARKNKYLKTDDLDLIDRWRKEPYTFFDNTL